MPFGTERRDCSPAPAPCIFACMNAVYLEHAPPPPLASALECLWTTTSFAPALSTATRVLPDGCIDLVFNLGDAVLRGGASDSGLRGCVAGAMTQAVTVHHPGRVEILGARFRPGAASGFLGLNARELTDRTVAIPELGAKLRDVFAPVLDAPGAAAAVPALSQALLRLRPSQPYPPTVEAAWRRIQGSGGALPVRALAAGLGVGERSLERLFRERVGVTPKEAARIARFRAAVAAMLRNPDRPLGRIALEAGYYDQPHFNREFLRLAGVAPEAWRSERTATP